jgi:hypothetical protein
MNIRPQEQKWIYTRGLVALRIVLFKTRQHDHTPLEVSRSDAKHMMVTSPKLTKHCEGKLEKSSFGFA